MNNQKKGYMYEIQIRDYIINCLKNPAYLWSDTPETILIQYNIIGSHNINRLIRKDNKLNPLQDTGIDIIQLEGDSCSLVQCKNGYARGLKIEDLAGFNAWMNAVDTSKGYVYYTNKLSRNILELPKNKRIEYIKQPFNNVIEEKNIITYKPFDYQLDAIKKFTEHFENNNRGILSMPCGTGKTFTSYLISNEYKQVIIISPLKEFAKQNLNRYIEYGYKNNNLLVSSDGTRNVDEIKKFIKSNDKFLLSSTFCSIDCIQQILQYCINPLIIIDEFHNLSKNNVINEEDDFYKILNSNHEIMFMSATPRVYELEDELYDVECIFGDVFYSMTFTEAIENKYITDYKIWLPSIHENNDELNKELSIYMIDETIKAKCNFFFSCIINNGSKKCIIYCIDTTEITNMIKAMNILNEFFCLDFMINQITATDTDKERIRVLNEFTTNNKIQLLFSVRILDECIDIPACDSIFITYPTQSKIRTIQRLSRCIRTNKLNPFKIGNIYIWCDEYNMILETLSGIKEYDIFFKDKIKINSIDFYNNIIKEGVESDNKLIEKYIVDIKEFRQYTWNERLEMVKKYIDENNKRPSTTDNDERVKKLRIWISNTNTHFNHKINIMKNKEYYDKWKEFINSNKYSEYFVSSDDIWFRNLNDVKKYMDTHKKRPTFNKINTCDNYLSDWLINQTTKYNNNILNEAKRKLWLEFINNDNYKIFFQTNEQIWFDNFNKIKKYIDDNNIRPRKENKNIEIKKLGLWINHALYTHKIQTGIMKKEHIRNIWTEFINNPRYINFFINEDDIWLCKFEELKSFVDNNDKLPPTTSKNIIIKKLAEWVCIQKNNYKKKLSNMKNDNIYDTWKNFISDNKYKKYFMSNEEVWFKRFEDVKQYISVNNKKPSSNNDNDDVKSLSYWVSEQKLNYKRGIGTVSNSNIYNKWTEFINDPIYKQYL